jgi:hypothetical protein
MKYTYFLRREIDASAHENHGSTLSSSSSSSFAREHGLVERRDESGWWFLNKIRMRPIDTPYDLSAHAARDVGFDELLKRISGVLINKMKELKFIPWTRKAKRLSEQTLNITISIDINVYEVKLRLLSVVLQA